MNTSLESEFHTRAPDGLAGRARSDGTSAVSRDALSRTLRSSRNRATLRYLTATDGPVKMGDVADHVAAAEHDTTAEALTDDQRQRVYVALYRSLLPALDEDGFVEYDKARGIVRPTEQIEQFRSYLEFTADEAADAAVSTDEGRDRMDRGDESDQSPPTTAGKRQSVSNSNAESTGEASVLPTGVTVGLVGIASLGLLATPALAVSGTAMALFATAMAVASRSF